MLMKKTTGFVVFILCLLVNCLLVHGAPGDFTVQLHGDSLTLSAEKTHLRTILTELASQGVIVKLDPQVNPLITTNYSNRPAEQVFGAILTNASYSLLWESQKDHDGANKIVLKEIQIFESGRKDKIKQILPPQNLVIVQHKDGSYHVKNEILFRLATGSDVSDLTNFLRQYDATVTQSKIPGIYRIVFPEDVDGGFQAGHRWPGTTCR